MNPKPPELLDEMRQVGDRIKALDAKGNAIQENLKSLLERIPNIDRKSTRLNSSHDQTS